MESKIESKLRLDFFLAQGLELINSDVTIGPIGNDVTIGDDNRFNWNLKSHIDKECFIKSLAPRENKGVQPVRDDVVVDVVFVDGDKGKVLAAYVGWALHGEGDEILNWKPNLDALIELQEKPKVTQVKPEVDYWVVTVKGGCFDVWGRTSSGTRKELRNTFESCTRFGYENVRIRPVYKKRDTHHSK